MDFKDIAEPRGSAFTFPFSAKTRRGSDVYILAFFPRNKRPWIGVYSPVDKDGPDREWVPMSWTQDGRFNADQKSNGEQIETQADVPLLAEKYLELRGT